MSKVDLVTFELLFQQGYGYHRQGQLTNAKSCYQQALQIQPQHFDSLHLLGLIAGQEGEPELAVKLIGQAVRLKSDNAVAHFARLIRNRSSGFKVNCRSATFKTIFPSR